MSKEGLNSFEIVEAASEHVASLPVFNVKQERECDPRLENRSQVLFYAGDFLRTHFGKRPFGEVDQDAKYMLNTFPKWQDARSDFFMKRRIPNRVAVDIINSISLVDIASLANRTVFISDRIFSKTKNPEYEKDYRDYWKNISAVADRAVELMKAEFGLTGVHDAVRELYEKP